MTNKTLSILLATCSFIGFSSDAMGASSEAATQQADHSYYMLTPHKTINRTDLIERLDSISVNEAREMPPTRSHGSSLLDLMANRPTSMTNENIVDAYFAGLSVVNLSTFQEYLDAKVDGLTSSDLAYAAKQSISLDVLSKLAQHMVGFTITPLHRQAVIEIFVKKNITAEHLDSDDFILQMVGRSRLFDKFLTHKMAGKISLEIEQGLISQLESTDFGTLKRTTSFIVENYSQDHALTQKAIGKISASLHSSDLKVIKNAASFISSHCWLFDVLTRQEAQVINKINHLEAIESSDAKKAKCAARHVIMQGTTDLYLFEKAIAINRKQFVSGGYTMGGTFADDVISLYDADYLGQTETSH